MPALGLTLAALLGAALVLRDRSGISTTLVLLLNWVVLTSVYELTGVAYDPGLYFAVDYTSAWMLFMLCRNRAQLVVILLFGLEIIHHSARLMLEPTAWTEHVGWWFLYYVAIVQAVICGGSILVGGLKSRFGNRDVGRRSLAGDGVLDSMARNGSER